MGREDVNWPGAEEENIELVPSFVRLASPVHDERRLGVEPLGTLGAVVPAEAGQVLGGLGVLVLLEVFGGYEVGLDLVDVPPVPARLG